MHCEIIDRYFNGFFVQIQLKKENFKSFFWVPEFGHPNRYTGLQNSLNMSLQVAKNQDDSSLLREMLKESCNLIGWEQNKN